MTTTHPAARQNKDRGSHLALVSSTPVIADQRIMSLTHNAEALAKPTTLPQRLAARRIELGLSHGQIAEQVVVRRTDTKTHRRKNVPLARNTYCNYERGTVPPKVEVLAQIAKILQTSLEYLLFGGESKPTTLKRVEFDTGAKAFLKVQEWSIDHDWLVERFGKEAHMFVLARLPEDTPHAQQGDIAILRTDVTPSASSGEYIYAHKNRCHAAKIVRPAASPLLRIYNAEGDHYEEFPQSKVIVLGKIVGKIGGLMN